MLLPRAAGARQVLPELLGAAGAHLDVVVVYRMVANQDARPALEEAMASPLVDCVVFASGSSVECFLKLWGDRPVPGSVLIACIGPITAQTVQGSGLTPGLVAEEHSLAGVVAALEMHLGPLPDNGRQT
jgi:uroporphyrinogen III methyltransferase/synthase